MTIDKLSNLEDHTSNICNDIRSWVGDPNVVPRKSESITGPPTLDHRSAAQWLIGSRKMLKHALLNPNTITKNTPWRNENKISARAKETNRYPNEVLGGLHGIAPGRAPDGSPAGE